MLLPSVHAKEKNESRPSSATLCAFVLDSIFVIVTREARTVIPKVPILRPAVIRKFVFPILTVFDEASILIVIATARSSLVTA